jgi:hypothetical protein
MSVQLKQNPDLSLGLQGTDAGDGEFIVVTIPWSAITHTTGAFLTASGPTLSRRMVVKSITYHNDTAASNAVTASLFKAAAGTAIVSGVALHSGTANLQSAANTPVTLTLSAVSGALDVAAGTRLGFVISGAPGAAGVGSITITLGPA